jgi:hypothetical protein
MVCNVFQRETTPGSGACGTGEPVPVDDPQVAFLDRAPRRLAALKRMIEFQEKVVLKMINGDTEEYLQPPPKKPRLRVVK